MSKRTPPKASKPRKLTPKQMRFVGEYLLEPSLTKAASVAYPECKHPGKLGFTLMENDRIRAAIEDGQSRAKAELELKAKNKGITEEAWMNSVAEIAFADMDTFISETVIPTPAGPTYKYALLPKAQRPKGSGRLIRKIRIHANGTADFELHPKHPAQELLARHFGWIYDKVEHSGAVGQQPTASEADMKRIMADPEAAKLARALAMQLAKPDGKPPEGGSNV